MSETKLQSRILIRSQKKEVSKLNSNKTLERNYNFVLLSSHNLRSQYQYIVWVNAVITDLLPVLNS